MAKDNAIYTVTPPDLHLTENGPTVLISSTNPDFIERVKEMYADAIHDISVVFCVQSKRTNENTVGWMWYVSRTCDTMIVDIDTCGWVDIATALTKEQDHNHAVVFYSEKQKRLDAVKLINATSSYIILRSLDEIASYINLEFPPVTE